MRTQDLNIPKDIITPMGNTYIESDERVGGGGPYDSGYAGLLAQTLLWASASKGLYVVSVTGKDAPKLGREERVLSQIPMGTGAIDYLVNGKEEAMKVAERIHELMGQPVGISKYDGHPSLTHIQAQEAMREAGKAGKTFILFEQADMRH